MIQRILENKIRDAISINKVVVLLGARRVGKTTLMKSIVDSFADSKYINCDLLQNKEMLQTTNSELLFNFLGKYKFVVLDEAQSIKNIGEILKIIHDTYPEIKIVATGSSAFYLNQQTGEPLTGRSRFYTMTPLSLEEVKNNTDILTINAQIETILRFGLYPEVYNKNEQYAKEELENIASNYLYKDILQFENLKRPEILYNLLKLLALQVGSEVSLNELSNKIGTHVNTVKRYINLLEQNYVIFKLPAFSNNQRNEISKNNKIYFYDCGIRNAIINNFNPLSLRNDIGALWENFFISERLKNNLNSKNNAKLYFWRNYQNKEIDLIEDYEGKLTLFECKYSPTKKVKIPTDFAEKYSNFEFNVISHDNYWKFL